jgi:hypothetical protein
MFRCSYHDSSDVRLNTDINCVIHVQLCVFKQRSCKVLAQSKEVSHKNMWVFFTQSAKSESIMERSCLFFQPHASFLKLVSSVGIVLGYELDDWSYRVRFPAGTGNFSLHYRVQNISGAHPPSYPMGIRGSFPGGKATGAWSWPLISI